MSSFRVRIAAAALTGTAAVATVLVATVPPVRFAYRAPALHVALETTSALIMLFATLLVTRRLRTPATLRDVLVWCGLGALGVSALIFSAVPAAIPGSALRPFATWAPLAASTLGAACLAAAAAAAPRLAACRLTRPLRVAACATVVMLGAVAIVAFVVETRLRPGLPPDLSPAGSRRPLLLGSLPLLVGQSLCAALYAVAATGFVLRSVKADEQLLRWIGLASVLFSFARVHYLLFPSLYLNWVYTGDAVRLGAQLLVLVGAYREVTSYWQALAASAALEERRRIARDLHDGLAQELAYIAAEASGELASTAARALDESRRAIAALTRPTDEPLTVALAQAAEEVAHRSGLRLRLALAEGADAPAPVREDLIRIVREALANAARHSGAHEARVTLEHRPGLRLTVADEGSGFDPSRPQRGFGLTSIRERAAALGGHAVVRSRPGSGTCIEVTLP